MKTKDIKTNNQKPEKGWKEIPGFGFLILFVIVCFFCGPLGGLIFVLFAIHRDEKIEKNTKKNK